jgi:hypothetical protein
MPPAPKNKGATKRKKNSLGFSLGFDLEIKKGEF